MTESVVFQVLSSGVHDLPVSDLSTVNTEETPESVERCKTLPLLVLCPCNGPT